MGKWVLTCTARQTSQSDNYQWASCICESMSFIGRTFGKCSAITCLKIVSDLIQSLFSPSGYWFYQHPTFSLCCFVPLLFAVFSITYSFYDSVWIFSFSCLQLSHNILQPNFWFSNRFITIILKSMSANSNIWNPCGLVPATWLICVTPVCFHYTIILWGRQPLTLAQWPGLGEFEAGLLIQETWMVSGLSPTFPCCPARFLPGSLGVIPRTSSG